VVFSEQSSDAMVATGITDEPSTARWMVETVLADTSHAAWGEVRRVPAPGEVPSEAELSQWPARGEVYECRRSARGGWSWQSLFPARPGAARPGVACPGVACPPHIPVAPVLTSGA
jgi:hypothetical protein